MIEGVIYRYKSPSGKYYIGQTIDEGSRRKNFLSIKKRYGGYKIDRARKKYGPENFEYTVLMKVAGDDPKEVKQYLNTLEIGFIRMYDSFNNGYNSTLGGDSLTGYIMTEEHRNKIVESHIGKHQSNETREKRRATMLTKNMQLSESAKKKISDRMKGNTFTLGHKHSKESIEKMRLVQKKSVETRRKISESLMGHKHSEETRRKISESHMGHICTTKGRHRVYNPDGSYRMIKDPDPIISLW